MSALSQPSGAAAPPCESADLHAVRPGNTDRTVAQHQAKFDLGIWHCLFNWPALTSAVREGWGGPDSADKRDWLAGAISDLFQNEPATDNEDVEVLLLQVLEDEFEIRLEDESEVVVAEQIMKIREQTAQGDYTAVEELQTRWEARKGKPVSTAKIQVIEHKQDAEWDSVDEESGSDEDGDVDMADAPPLVPAKPKPAPQVDDEGFTRVVGKKRK
ncbi:hypothetical protein P154DRAFT_437520 [Amniculicola lignicola CBS 123094]|uniref:Pre-rRNA-processing protein-like protein TSR2 n=1 Tax=Amniculicola lignicola CBS 123094 TaxID=1392246 RepID=A0A6A5WC61_9PLEO|nr:hypothetical protein P154DRAFT_437520 [Amniculicola lignicola CBS 123094]